jgi:hypothetical protein
MKWELSSNAIRAVRFSESFVDKYNYSRVTVIQGPIICGMDYLWSQIASNM